MFINDNRGESSNAPLSLNIPVTKPSGHIFNIECSVRFINRECIHSEASISLPLGQILIAAVLIAPADIPETTSYYTSGSGN